MGILLLRSTLDTHRVSSDCVALALEPEHKPLSHLLLRMFWQVQVACMGIPMHRPPQTLYDTSNGARGR